MLHLGKCEDPASLDRQPVQLRGGILVDVEMGEQGDAAFNLFRSGKPSLPS